MPQVRAPSSSSLVPLIQDTRIGSQSPNKRKRNAEEDDRVDEQEMSDAEVEADDEDDADGVDDDNDEPDTRPAKRKGKATASRKAKAKSKGPPPPKKPRMAKNTVLKPQKTPKPAKRKVRANGDFDADSWRLRPRFLQTILFSVRRNPLPCIYLVHFFL